ncbi:hypothetical protein LXL04_008057 [Taraxacum kok-saghyz]
MPQMVKNKFSIVQESSCSTRVVQMTKRLCYVSETGTERAPPFDEISVWHFNERKNTQEQIKNTQEHEEHSRTLKNMKNTTAFRENISNLYNALKEKKRM